MLPVLNIFFVAILIHVAAIFFGYPLAAVVNTLDVANRSVVYGSVVYFLGASALAAFDSVSAVYLAMLMVVSELCVLLNRAASLVPQAKRRGFF